MLKFLGFAAKQEWNVEVIRQVAYSECPNQASENEEWVKALTLRINDLPKRFTGAEVHNLQAMPRFHEERTRAFDGRHGNSAHHQINTNQYYRLIVGNGFS